MELTREQIKEGNEKLAKLIGWYQDPDGLIETWWENTEFAKYVAYNIGSNYPHRDLPFLRDWNYLMKVVDKIGTIVYHREGDALDYDWKKHYSYSELFREIFNKWVRYRFDTHSEEFNLMNDLQSVWSGCVGYVNYLENKKDEND